MALYYVAAETLTLPFVRTPVGPASDRGIVEGVWIDPEAPEKFPKMGYREGSVIIADGRKWYVISELGRFVNSDVYRESVPPIAVYEAKPIASYVRTASVQGKEFFDVYRAGWMDDEKKWNWGYYVEMEFDNDPGYSWRESAYLLVVPEEISEVLKNCRVQEIYQTALYQLLEAGLHDGVFADLPPACPPEPQSS